MITTHIPEPQETLNRLWPVISIAYDGLDFGTQKAREYFETEGAEINPYLAASITRWNARRHLDIQAQTRGILLELEDIANIGLRLTFRDHHVWIMKATNGDLPTPGFSAIKQNFYNQLLPFPDFPAEAGNIIILWDATRDYQLLGLSLVCPKSGDLTRESIDAYWQVPIPHPAYFVASHLPQDADATTVDNLDEIQRIEREKAKGDDEGDE